MKKHLVISIAVAALIATFTPAVHAVMVSGDFSVGYGFSPPGAWSTNETETANDPTTAPNPNGGTFVVGDFLYSVTVANSQNSSDGPIFTNRVLSTGGAGQTTAQSELTTVSITATYTGPAAPTGARDIGFQLDIDQISIWAHKHPVQEGTTNELWWIETTPGNSANSPSIYAPESFSFTLASDFLQLSWNPSEFFVTNGITATRTFAFPTDRNFMIDGLEIIGNGNFSYQIPEPSGLMIIGGLVLLLRRNRTRTKV